MTTQLAARQAFIERVLAAAPPMTAERRHRIATVLFGYEDRPWLRHAPGREGTGVLRRAPVPSSNSPGGRASSAALAG